MNINKSVVISTEVLSQEVSGETVLLDMHSESYFGLDAVGTRIWQLLQQQPDLRTVYAALLEEYEVDAGQLQSDLLELIASLEEAGLVTTREMDE
jgi:hypothetical protein